MTNELKPCPFCGGNAKLVRTPNCLYHIKCKTCRATIGEIKKAPSDFRTREEVISAWNTRYERTCKPIDEYCCGVPSCGECGVTLNMVVSGVRPFDKVLPNFCHNCGAKVSSDDE